MTSEDIGILMGRNKQEVERLMGHRRKKRDIVYFEARGKRHYALPK